MAFIIDAFTFFNGAVMAGLLRMGSDSTFLEVSRQTPPTTNGQTHLSGLRDEG